MPGDKSYQGNDGSTKVWKFTPGADSVVSVIDSRHFMHGKVNLLRYDLEGGTEMAARNLALVENIIENGVEQPGVIWWHNDLGHIISGTRRWNALEAANAHRRADKLDAFSMKFEVNSLWKESIAAEKWRRANQDQEKNDVLTRLEGAALDIDRGVALDRAAMVWDFSESQLKRALQPKGILDSADELKAALASGAIKLSAALKLCGLSKDEQRKALAGEKPQKSAEPKAPSLVTLKRLREELRADKLGNVMISPADVLDMLIGDKPDQKWSAAGEDLKSIIADVYADASKPGRKSEKKPSNFTKVEREQIREQ